MITGVTTAITTRQFLKVEFRFEWYFKFFIQTSGFTKLYPTCTDSLPCNLPAIPCFSCK